MDKTAPEKTQEMPERARESPSISISDGFILAALPVFAYIFHYFFEYGYLSYFGIPTAFISFNLTEIIPAIFFLVVAYFTFVFGVWPLLNRLLAALPRPVRTLLLFLPWLPVFAFLGFSWEVILVIFLCLLLIYAAERARIDRARVLADGSAAVIPATGPDGTSLEALISKIIPFGNRFLLFYFLFFALAGSILLGRVMALTRSAFPITDATPGCAVVYTTANRYICKPLNGSTFDDRFLIYYTEESQNLEFRSEELGPLRPSK